MRNQALIEQVELTNLEGETSFTLSLTLETDANDSDGDGLPNWWERDQNLDPDDGTGIHGADGNDDGDAFTNLEEYVLGLDTGVAEFNGLPRGTIAPTESGGFTVTFPVLADRTYRVWYVDDLTGTWQPASSAFFVAQDNDAYVFTDDGTTTAPDPNMIDARFYRIEISR